MSLAAHPPAGDRGGTAHVKRLRILLSVAVAALLRGQRNSKWPARAALGSRISLDWRIRIAPAGTPAQAARSAPRDKPAPAAPRGCWAASPAARCGRRPGWQPGACRGCTGPSRSAPRCCIPRPGGLLSPDRGGTASRRRAASLWPRRTSRRMRTTAHLSSLRL